MLERLEQTHRREAGRKPWAVRTEQAAPPLGKIGGSNGIGFRLQEQISEQHAPCWRQGRHQIQPSPGVFTQAEQAGNGGEQGRTCFQLQPPVECEEGIGFGTATRSDP